jgi:hypothetical protein
VQKWIHVVSNSNPLKVNKYLPIKYNDETWFIQTDPKYYAVNSTTQTSTNATNDEWSWESSWTILHNLLDVQYTNSMNDKLRDYALEKLLKLYTSADMLKTNWTKETKNENNFKELHNLTTLTYKKRVLSGNISCGFVTRDSSYQRDRLVRFSKCISFVCLVLFYFLFLI